MAKKEEKHEDVQYECLHTGSLRIEFTAYSSWLGRWIYYFSAVEVRKIVRVVKAFIICRIDRFNLGRLFEVGVVLLAPGMGQMIKSKGMTV